jgi:hypothetical protein
MSLKEHAFSASERAEFAQITAEADTVVAVAKTALLERVPVA